MYFGGNNHGCQEYSKNVYKYTQADRLGANALHKNRCSHVFAQKSLKLNITNIVNGTPDIILDKIDTHSLNVFTNYVKLFLLQTYLDTCIVPNCYNILYVRSQIL